MDALFRDACLLGWAGLAGVAGAAGGPLPSELTSEATTWHLPQLSNPSVTGGSEKDPCTLNHTRTHATDPLALLWHGYSLQPAGQSSVLASARLQDDLRGGPGKGLEDMERPGPEHVCGNRSGAGLVRLRFTTGLHLGSAASCQDGCSVCALPESRRVGWALCDRCVMEAPFTSALAASRGPFLVGPDRTRQESQHGAVCVKATCGTYLGARPAGLVPVGESNPSPGFADFSRFICCRIEFNSLITFAFGPERIGLLTSETSPHNLEVLGGVTFAAPGWALPGGGGGAGGGMTKLSTSSSTSAS